MKKVIVIGGGLAGLIAAIDLCRQGIDTLVIERKEYPFHRVCGEYISNEVTGFLQRNHLFPDQYNPPQISSLILSSVSGKAAVLPLDLGGFGISRYAFDHFLYTRGRDAGVEFLLNTRVTNVREHEGAFVVETDGGEYETNVVIGAFGKRSRLDKQLNRPFFKRRSPFIGVKYHIQYDGHPHDTIALHNFSNGYCGINEIEDGKHNLCYLSARSNLEEYRNIREMEEKVLCRNPELEKIFTSATFLFQKPEVINEISFETKKPVVQHILMCGDAAGMITPLCGNGMAMAIHSAKVLSEEVVTYMKHHRNRQRLEAGYTSRWNSLFRNRLLVGRQIQKLFGAGWTSEVAVEIARRSGTVSSFLVRQTHGKPF